MSTGWSRAGGPGAQPLVNSRSIPCMREEVGEMVNFESRTTSPASSVLTVHTVGSLQVCPLHPGTDHTRTHTRLRNRSVSWPCTRARNIRACGEHHAQGGAQAQRPTTHNTSTTPRTSAPGQESQRSERGGHVKRCVVRSAILQRNRY